MDMNLLSTANTITASDVIDLSSMTTAVVTVGGAALAAALSVGLGFKYGKKLYSWMTSKA